MNNADIAHEGSALLAAAALPTGVEGELTLVRSESRAVGWAQGKPHLQNAARTDGVCLRVLEAGGHGLVTTKGVEKSHLPALAAKALDIARLSPKDRYRRFAPSPRRLPAPPANDASLFSQSTAAIQERLSMLEKSILAADHRLKKVIRLHWAEEREERALANTASLSLASASTGATFVLEVLAEEDGGTEVAWDYRTARAAAALDWEAISQETAEAAARSLGGKPLPTGKIPVILEPRVGTQLLSLVAEALSAEAVQLGRSFLRNLKGQDVAASAVTIVDDPLLPDGIASAAFDDEGTPHQTLDVIRNGILLDYFYDLRSANRESRASNGHGIKAGLAAAPHPGATNLFIKKGERSISDLRASAPQVFSVREVMGLHMADPITGEFSLGASGWLFENGRFSRAVRGVTIASTVGEVLRNIAAVGADLTWYGAHGAPSLLVTGITVAGS